MAKKLKELFNRYTPDEQYVDIMELGVVENVRVSRESKLVEAEARFEKLIDKKKLYGLEEAIKKAYVLNGVRIIPKYRGIAVSAPLMSSPDRLMCWETDRITSNAIMRPHRGISSPWISSSMMRGSILSPSANRVKKFSPSAAMEAASVIYSEKAVGKPSHRARVSTPSPLKMGPMPIKRFPRMW